LYRWWNAGYIGSPAHSKSFIALLEADVVDEYISTPTLVALHELEIIKNKGSKGITTVICSENKLYTKRSRRPDRVLIGQ